MNASASAQHIIESLVQALQQAESREELRMVLEDFQQRIAGFSVLDATAYWYHGFHIEVGMTANLSQTVDGLLTAHGCQVGAAPFFHALVEGPDNLGVLFTRYEPRCQALLIPCYPAQGVRLTQGSKDQFLQDMQGLAEAGFVHDYAFRGYEHWLLQSLSGRVYLSDWHALRGLREGERENIMTRFRTLLDGIETIPEELGRTPAVPSVDSATLSQETLPVEEAINIISTDPQWAPLSNFAEAPFTLEGLRFTSMEAFIQYIKYPEGHLGKEAIKELSGPKAKKAGRRANIEYQQQLLRDPDHIPTVHWKGEELIVGLGEHMALLERALRAKFAQNPHLQELLLATGRRVLTHHTGHRSDAPGSFTTFSSEQFTGLLMRMREGFRQR